MFLKGGEGKVRLRMDDPWLHTWVAANGYASDPPMDIAANLRKTKNMTHFSLQQLNETPAPAKDWEAQRSPDRPADRVLSPLALRWSANLSPELRPRHLQMAFPRIANRIALCWCQGELANAVLGTLLFDNRNGLRKGFAKLIVDELWVLRHEVEERLAEGRVVDLWGQHSDAGWLRPEPPLHGPRSLAERPLRMYGKARSGY